jgi:glycine cleavage system H protein
LYPDDLRYHNEHTWARIAGDSALIGITDHAQQALGDISRIKLPEAGNTVEAGQNIADIEASNATASVISPLSGTIIRANDALEYSPDAINESPYGAGWIVELEVSDPLELDDLMGSSDYSRCIEDEDGW